MLMAAPTMATIPVLIIFLFAQRYFGQGSATSGWKGYYVRYLGRITDWNCPLAQS